MREKTILVADPDREVRAFIKRALLLDGYEILEAANGVEANLFCNRYNGPIDLLLTDMRLPGIELISNFRELFPKTPIVYMAAPGGLEAVSRSMFLNGSAFLAKPFGADVLLENIRELVGQSVIHETGGERRRAAVATTIM